MRMEISLHRKFVRSTLDLDPADAQRVWKAVEQYGKDPNAPSLHLERLKGRAGNSRLCSIRASDELRVLLALQGQMSVLLRAGHHDDIYDLANRFAFVAPVSGRPGLIRLSHHAVDVGPPAEAGAPAYSAASVGDRQPSILEHWSTGELVEAGFDPEAIELLRRATADDLLDVWPDIDDETLSKTLELSEISPEEWRQQRFPDDEMANERFRDAIVNRGALAGLSSVLSPDELQRLVSAPIEEWMIFLHPYQRPLVDRQFNGPARVRGSAGTGKTVVALHRAAVLAKRFARESSGSGAPVLFTTYVNHLPPVFESLYQRLPSAINGAVEFINIDKLARRVCVEAGFRPVVDRRISDSTFAKACEKIVKAGTPLDRARVTRRYLREEVASVMKGRGIASLDEYLGMERTGRRMPFAAPMREQAWALREEWDRRLVEASVLDFPDVVMRARDLARRRSAPMFRAAIVDEAQDLTLVGLQLVHALVNGPEGIDRPDGLFIVGDGAQKIYPGGFTLAQAGVDVRGNSSVLHLNYRNTRQVIETAMACAGSQLVDDLGDEYARGDAEAEASRKGARPFLVEAGDFDGQVSFAAEQIERLCDDKALSPGDVAVCAPSNRLVKKAISGLEAAGLRVQNLSDFTGQSNEQVKVGTFHRSKGLEFKVVFLLDLSAGSFPLASRGQSDAERSDQRELQVGWLYVAMTRARDGLYVLHSGEPSDVLYEALDFFEIVESDGTSDFGITSSGRVRS